MPRDMFIIFCCYTMLQRQQVLQYCLYVHIGVGSALLVSTTWAMRRPRKVRRVTGTGSHAFLFIGIHIAESGELIGTDDKINLLSTHKFYTV